jgi:hypothetical protein
VDTETLETLEETPTQVAANTAPPVLNLPSQDKMESVPSVNLNQAEPVPAQDPNGLAHVQMQEKRIEEGQVNIAVPSTTEVQPVVPVGETTAEGISTSSLEENELIDQKELESATNVKKSKFAIKINLGKQLPLLQVIIISVGVLIVGMVLGRSLFPQLVYTNSYNPTANSNAAARVVDGKNNVTIAGKYKFTIPEKYYYDKTESGLLVYDTNDTFRIYIRGEEGIYDDIANAKSSVKATIINAGLNVTNIKEVTINKRNYVIAETIDGLVNRLIAFTKASDTEIFYVEIVTTENNYDYDVVDLADDIIANAAFQSETSKMESTDIHDIASLVIAASEVYKSLAS